MPNYLAANRITNAQQNFTQEVRIQSNEPASRLQWTVGVFYAFDRQQSNEQILDPELPQLTQLLWGEDMLTAWGENLLPGGVDYDNDTRAHDRQTALYADATYAITDKFKVNLGLRYAWTKFAFLNTNDGPQDLLDNGGVPALSTGGKSEKPFTPKVSLSYQATSDDMVYATVAKGYRIGGATPPLPVVACGPGYPDQYDSDSVWSYEAGTKDRFFRPQAVDRRQCLLHPMVQNPAGLLCADMRHPVHHQRWSGGKQGFRLPGFMAGEPRLPGRRQCRLHRRQVRAHLSRRQRRHSRRSG